MAKSPDPAPGPPPEPTTLPAPSPRLVTVKALAWHTHNGVEHAEGEIYELEESLVASVVQQKTAAPVE